MQFDANAISQIILLVLSSVGVTQVAKKAVAKGMEVSLSPVAKRAIAVVAAIVLGIVTGQDVDTILPGGGASDGAIAGIVGTALYALIAPKSKS